MKETPIVRECMTCFSHRGYQILMPGWRTPYPVQTTKGVVWRANVGGMLDKSGRHFIRFGVNGMADIMGVKFGGGMVFGFEVKKPGEKPTDMQEWFGCILITAGGKWGWGTSYAECNQWAIQEGL